MSRRLTGLLMGLRFAVAGGRGGWTRAAMTAVGVGLGVALLLVAASIPAMMQARSDRGTGRAAPFETGVAPSDRTVVVAQVQDEYHGEQLTGTLVRPDGAHPVVPPGLSALPGPGQAVVSPALRRLLDSGDGALLRPRFPYQIVGTIGDQGLLGPAELTYYAGDATLAGQRVDRFGDDPDTEPLSPTLVLLAIIGFVVLLLPVAVFVGTAVRFGGDGRDRRLAALRLAGADRVTARWIGAGEALAGAVVGLGVGGLLLLAFRSLVSRVTVWDISVYGRDVRPDPVFAALVVVAVPLLAVAVTLLALRRVSIEPLGVVRQGGQVRRRVWWRVLLPVAGLLVLAPAVRQMRATHSDPSVYPVAVGVVLLLVGVTALLPWLVEAAVRRLRGGPVPWQLATRRLQLDGGTAARLVSGIAVAVAGGIGLQMLFAGVQGGFTHATGQDPSRYQIGISFPAGEPPVAALQQVPGVRGALSFSESWLTPAATPDGDGADLLVGGCATLLQLMDADGCADGDVFLVTDQEHGAMDGPLPAPGTAALVGRPDEATGPDAVTRPTWTVPAGARTVSARRGPSGATYSGVFATPGALRGVTLPGAVLSTVLLAVDPNDRDAVERVRDTAFAADHHAAVYELSATRVDPKFANIQRGLFLGVVAMLLLIGTSLLVSMLEQLAERRRLLAMLVAVGTRRSALGWSLLVQAAIPMLLGLALALVTGTVLGSVLLSMASATIRVDWAGLGSIAGVAALVVVVVTVLSLPAQNRLMRTAGLRTE